MMYKIEEYITAVSRRHPILGKERVWCTADGLKLLLQKTGNPVLQNRFYNGWTCDHYVTCVYVIAPDGTIVNMAINSPGSFHDSTIAGTDQKGVSGCRADKAAFDAR